MPGPLLLVTATDLEAEPLKTELSWESVDFPLGQLYRLAPNRPPAPGPRPPLFLAHLGVAKVNTAAGLALLIDRLEPRAVLQFGIGGAFAGSFLSVGMLAVADREVHLDTGLATEGGWQGMEALGFPLAAERYNVFPTDPGLSRQVAAACGAHACSFGTSETVTGSLDGASALRERFDVSVESMEGAAAAQVCYALRVPFAELRGVSNIVGERDKKAWDIPTAVRRVNAGVRAFVTTALPGRDERP